MANTVKIRRSGTTTSTPSSLDHGELAINYADDTLFWKDSSDTIQSFVFQAYATATHKSSHATGGSDALTPSDIGAAPAANPAITGNATFDASSGVPLTVTNTGTGNSFVVNDASGDATPFVVDAAGIVGIQNSNPQSVTFQGLLLGAGTGNIGLTLLCSTSASGTIAFGDGTTGNESYRGYVQYLHANDAMQFGTSAATRLFISSSGNVGIGTTTPASRLDVNGVITVSATSGSAGSYLPSLTFSGDSNTGLGQVGGADSVSLITAGSERVRVDSFGRLTIFATSASTPCVFLNSASNGQSLDIRGRSSDGTGIFQFSTSGGTLVSRIVNSTTDMSIRAAADGRISLAKNDGTNVVQSKSTGAVRFVPLASDPASGEAGDVYYNSTDNKLRVYNGSAFVGAAPAANPTFTGTAAFELVSALAISGTGGRSEWIDGDPRPNIFQTIGSGTDFAGESGHLAIQPRTNLSRDIIFGGGVGTTVERMRIKGSGNVGIGTASPASRLDVNGVITVSAGTAAAPAIVSGTGTSDTGVFWPAADTVAISTAGSERVRITSAGRVGIGTASPASSTHVDMVSSVGELRIYNNSATTGTARLRLRSVDNNASSFVSFDTGGIIRQEIVKPSSSADLQFRSNTAGGAACGYEFHVSNGSSEFMSFRVKRNGAVRFVPLASDPASGEAGDVYYNSTDNKLRVYNGTSWIDLH